MILFHHDIINFNIHANMIHIGRQIQIYTKTKGKYVRFYGNVEINPFPFWYFPLGLGIYFLYICNTSAFTAVILHKKFVPEINRILVSLLYSNTMFACVYACLLVIYLLWNGWTDLAKLFCLLRLGHGVVLGQKNPHLGSGFSGNPEKPGFQGII